MTAATSIVDVDVHVSDAPAALAPYVAPAWRPSLDALAATPARYLDVPGYAPNLKLDPPIPGGHPYRSVRTAAEMRAGLAALGIETAVLFPDHLLLFATIPHPEYALELSRAYNRWLFAEWTEEPGLWGAILACPQDPAAAARDIAERARQPKAAAVFLPTAGVNPLWGHRRYDPILAAASEADLPVVLHSVTVVTPSFPCQLDQFENHFARQVLSHSFAMMANLVSLIQSGVPARFPGLRIVFTEAGIGWAPYFTWRLDRYHGEYRRTVPVLARRPSDYIREQVWFATQPLEEPDDPAHYADLVRLVGEDRIVFASDWPHHDFDHPKAIHRLPIPAETKRKILGENALNAFTRLARAARTGAAAGHARGSG
jgi:predicted TIM-barrel fold metal-dependent hydrolase